MIPSTFMSSALNQDQAECAAFGLHGDIASDRDGREVVRTSEK
jgi:hypothetical protein